MPNLRGKTWTTSTPANVEDAQYWEDHLISDTAALKAASSVQSVNSITPDAQGNVDVVALPAGGTAGQVLTKQSSTTGDADWEDPASSGHTIEDEDGNIMPYQETLQFENAEVTNDSVNNKTIVDCKGSKGDAATITIGTVTTLPAGSDATVTNSGTSSDAVFDFGIPKGADGEGAVDSVNGQTGVVVLDASDVGALPDSTTIPTSLSELSDDTTHRLVTDAEKTAWDAKVSESLLKDTVGWVGKNENKTPYYDGTSKTENGVTFSVDGNGVIGLANTASADAQFYMHSRFAYDMQLKAGSYKISGGINDDIYLIAARNNTTGSSSGGGSQLAVDKGSGASFTINETIDFQFIVFVKNGTNASGKTVYPMLYKASITDSTFEPYHKPVTDVITDVYGVMGENGAKNLMPFPYYAMSYNNHGITITVDNDGVVDVDGTSDASIYFYLKWTDVCAFSKPLILNGCPIGGGSGKYRLFLSDTSTSTEYNDFGSGVNVPSTINGHNYNIGIHISSGQTFSHVKFRPMLRLASDPDDTYVPYAMTNRELTEASTKKTVTPTVDGTIIKSIVDAGYVEYDLLTRICNYSFIIRMGTFSHYQTVISGMPKCKKTSSVLCQSTSSNSAPILGFIIPTNSTSFTILKVAGASYDQNVDYILTGSYIIADDVVS